MSWPHTTLSLWLSPITLSVPKPPFCFSSWAAQPPFFLFQTSHDFFNWTHVLYLVTFTTCSFGHAYTHIHSLALKHTLFSIYRLHFPFFSHTESHTRTHTHTLKHILFPCPIYHPSLQFFLSQNTLSPLTAFLTPLCGLQTLTIKSCPFSLTMCAVNFAGMSDSLERTMVCGESTSTGMVAQSSFSGHMWTTGPSPMQATWTCWKSNIILNSRFPSKQSRAA